MDKSFSLLHNDVTHGIINSLFGWLLAVLVVFPLVFGVWMIREHSKKVDLANAIEQQYGINPNNSFYHIGYKWCDLLVDMNDHHTVKTNGSSDCSEFSQYDINQVFSERTSKMLWTSKGSDAFIPYGILFALVWLVGWCLLPMDSKIVNVNKGFITLAGVWLVISVLTIPFNFGTLNSSTTHYVRDNTVMIYPVLTDNDLNYFVSVNSGLFSDWTSTRIYWTPRKFGER